MTTRKRLEESCAENLGEHRAMSGQRRICGYASAGRLEVFVDVFDSREITTENPDGWREDRALSIPIEFGEWLARAASRAAKARVVTKDTATKVVEK